MLAGVHLDLDGAWGDAPLGLPTRDARAWGPRLRYIAPSRVVDEFARQVVAGLPPAVLYGSGDFHHLAGLFVGKVAQPVVVVSFDNHPDWDRRPPRWACGGWVHRVLRSPRVRSVAVWGCGNFELDWPGRFFGSTAELAAGRLQVFPWARRYGPATRKRYACVTGESWRDEFARFADGLAGAAVYVTVDLDCLAAGEAVTNWENGLFTAGDLAWAVARLRARSRLVGADVCGAWSAQAYARSFQRFAGWWDHPRLGAVWGADEALRINLKAIATIWPALTGV